ncbi:SDR family oxidoreductase [Bradyrhizobium sp. CCGUVB4N]|uniref:SDR family oxidoreductase n=1 Tax=Bradyrhizobium sp. CCGUVB4N TaxID=2949631 RepID=UPI0020B2D9D7|nr:SDR family oxidoreductase [Bradyrhizobium sp. CCGUVB4N]MCP3379856.1 SDR family oxidoreductase [Bradyrhizobium sp. CCGUVB4N]
MTAIFLPNSPTFVSDYFPEGHLTGNRVAPRSLLGPRHPLMYAGIGNWVIAILSVQGERSARNEENKSSSIKRAVHIGRAKERNRRRNMGKLGGKVAVITGGSDGMGLATAKLFAREGAKVIITGRDQARLDAAAQGIGNGADAIGCDISKIADIEALRAFVERKHGRVDIIFANAGAARPNMFEYMSEEEFDFTIDCTFKGTYFTVQKLLPLMTSGGSIVLNTTTLTTKGMPYVSVYSAGKAAIRSLARSLTAELIGKGIRVNAMAPGYIDTDQARKSGVSEEMIQQTKTHVHTQIPMHRSGTVDEIAKAVLFLASDDSSYLTGSELCVDGGWNQV